MRWRRACAGLLTLALVSAPAIGAQPPVAQGYYREAWVIRPQETDAAPRVFTTNQAVTEAQLDPLKLVVADADLVDADGTVIAENGTQLNLMDSPSRIACMMEYRHIALKNVSGSKELCFLDEANSGTFSSFFVKNTRIQFREGFEIPNVRFPMRPGGYHIDDNRHASGTPKIVVRYDFGVFDGAANLMVCILEKPTQKVNTTRLCLQEMPRIQKQYYPAKLNIYGGIIEISKSADNKTQFQLLKPFENRTVYFNH